MYRIDTEKLANFKEATIGLREGLEEARDNHVLQMGALEENWEGEGADSALAAGQELTVQMEDEIASLKGLEEVLWNALENARRLRVQSKKFVEILKDDESSLHYTGHGYAIGAPIGDGVISLEESTVTQLVESCNHAAETAREIEDITSEIDELLGSMEYVHIDISDQTEKIRKDCKKVERLEEYGRSYRRYAEEFIELDRYLCKALEPYQSEENKGLTEMDLRRYNYYANSPGKREKTAEGEALPVIAGGVTAALLGVEPFIDVTITPGEDYTQEEEIGGNDADDLFALYARENYDYTYVATIIAKFEDFSATPYYATELEQQMGLKTIGFGHLDSAGEYPDDYVMTEEEAWELLISDIQRTYPEEFIIEVVSKHGALTQNQVDALVMLGFNNPALTPIESPNFLILLQQESYESEEFEKAVVDQFYTYCKQKDVVLGGLVKRSTAEAMLFLEGEYFEEYDDLYSDLAVLEKYREYMEYYECQDMIQYLD